MYIFLSIENTGRCYLKIASCPRPPPALSPSVALYTEFYICEDLLLHRRHKHFLNILNFQNWLGVNTWEKNILC